MNTEPNTTTATELLEKLRQLLDLPTCLDHAATRIEECVNALAQRITSTEHELTKLKDQVTVLGERCGDLSCELCAAVKERDIAQEDADKYKLRCEDLRDDLRYATRELDEAREEAEDARDAAEELRDLSELAASEIHDRHPHLLDDLLDYTAHLRHTGGDRKIIDLLELTTACLRTISNLLY